MIIFTKNRINLKENFPVNLPVKDGHTGTVHGKRATVALFA
jgi:hypothetical protein